MDFAKKKFLWNVLLTFTSMKFKTNQSAQICHLLSNDNTHWFHHFCQRKVAFWSFEVTFHHFRNANTTSTLVFYLKLLPEKLLKSITIDPAAVPLQKKTELHAYSQFFLFISHRRKISPNLIVNTRRKPQEINWEPRNMSGWLRNSLVWLGFMAYQSL